MSELIICTVMSGGKTLDLGDKTVGDKMLPTLSRYGLPTCLAAARVKRECNW